MNKEQIRYEILGMAVEDYHGLWEISWGLRPMLTNISDIEIRDLAENVVRELLSKGWILLFRRTGAAGEEIPLKETETQVALSDKLNWREPTAETIQILIAATEEGERIYYKN